MSEIAFETPEFDGGVFVKSELAVGFEISLPRACSPGVDGAFVNITVYPLFVILFLSLHISSAVCGAVNGVPAISFQNFEICETEEPGARIPYITSDCRFDDARCSPNTIEP